MAHRSSISPQTPPPVRDLPENVLPEIRPGVGEVLRAKINHKPMEWYLTVIKNTPFPNFSFP
jgi:hypothetical protein